MPTTKTGSVLEYESSLLLEAFLSLRRFPRFRCQDDMIRDDIESAESKIFIEDNSRSLFDNPEMEEGEDG